MIKNYIKIAFRNFWRHKLFTLINVIGLSIGISAAIVIYLIVHFDLNFDKFEPGGDRVYRVVTNFTFSGEPAYNPGVCGPLPWAVKGQVSGLELAAPFFKLLLPDVSVSKTETSIKKFKQQQNIVLTEKAYFKLVPYKWLAGSSVSLDQPNHVVLTSERAKLYFPDLSYSQVIGKTVLYDSLKVVVTGVVETLTENTDFTFTDFISFATAFTNKDLKADLRLQNWGRAIVRSQLFIRLFPETKVASVEKQLNDILKKNDPPTPQNRYKTQQFALQPLADIHFNEKYGGIANSDSIANKTTLYGLLAIAMFLLLLGCINFINLTTAQAAQRAKEIGIRKTMGSSRGQLVVQFLSETFLITLVAVVISAVLSPVILQQFAGFIPTGIKANLLGQPGILLFLFLLTIAVSLLSGFYPAVILSGYQPVLVLKNQAQSNSNKTRNAWLRKSLTVTQFIIAQFFIMATILVSKQIYYAVHKELGFKKDAIIIVNSPFKNRNAGSNRVFLNKIRAVPGVEMVSMGNDPPSSENTSSTQATYRDGKKEVNGELYEKFGDENYIRLYHIKLLAGRNLLPGDANKAFLINAAYTRLMGLKDPHDAIGKVIDDFNGNMRMQVIGVVSDFHQESLHAPIAPLAILTSTDPGFNGTFHIALKPVPIAIGTGSDDWKNAIKSIQEAWAAVYPADDFEYHFIDETIAKFYEKEQQTSILLTWATGLSILISCLGLLGLAIYTTNQRTKEIGVRKVLGATVTQIVTLLSTELVLLILLAFIIVTPIAWYAMNKWMQTFADRTTISWWIFAASGAGMLLAAVFTSSFQTVKAAVANPVKSLRSE
jgi:ABC-type antimicrobial peptide transport system permease subunit